MMYEIRVYYCITYRRSVFIVLHASMLIELLLQTVNDRMMAFDGRTSWNFLLQLDDVLAVFRAHVCIARTHHTYGFDECALNQRY